MQPKIDKVIHPSKVMTFKRLQELTKVRQRKMYKIYLAFRGQGERNQMTTKIPAPKIPGKLQQEETESRGLAYGCQNSSVRGGLETGRASPIIYIRDHCGGSSTPTAVASFLMS